MKNYYIFKIIESEESQNIDILGNFNSFFKMKEIICNNLHFLGNLLGIKCTQCGHQTRSHQSNSRTSWICKECEEGKNICSIVIPETFESLPFYIRKFFNQFSD